MDQATRDKLRAAFKESGNSGDKIHVAIREGKWIIFKEGSTKAMYVFNDRLNAIEKALVLYNNRKSSGLVIHAPDGSVESMRLQAAD